MPSQMGEFDFISVLISIVIGLGVTNLLSGAGRAFYRRRKNPVDEVHMVLTGFTLLQLLLNWWVTFSWRSETNWTFEKFLVLILWTIALYMLTVFLYPPDLSQAEEHRDVWMANRASYYGTFVCFTLLDILQTATRGSLFHPIWYLPFVAHHTVLGAIGLGLRRRGYDRFFAWYELIILLVWSVVVRRFLVRIV